MIRVLAAFTVLAAAFFLARPAQADPSCVDAAEHGQELRDAHQLVEARRELVICADRACPTAVRESCTEWLAALGPRIPSIVAGAKDDAGHDIPGLRVSMDGAELPPSVASAATPVNPGPHVMRYEAPGYEAQAESIIVREGEPLRVLTVTLRRNAAHADVRHARVAPIALGATAAVALTVFGIAAVKGALDYRRLDRACRPQCSAGEIDGVKSTFLVADIGLVVGLVTGGAAAAFWIFGRPTESAERR
jgi:hypothetical protein